MTKLRYEDYGDDIEPDDVDRAQDAEEDARSRVYYEDCLEQMYESLYLHDDDLDLGECIDDEFDIESYGPYDCPPEWDHIGPGDIDEGNAYVARLISSDLSTQPSEGG